MCSDSFIFEENRVCTACSVRFSVSVLLYFRRNLLIAVSLETFETN